MPIFTLIALTFALFLTLWMADLFFTTRSVSKLGVGVELNPYIRFIMSIRGKYIWPFKALEIILFSYVIWATASFDEEVSFSVLLGVIFVYCFVVAMGLKVFIDLTGKSAPVAFLFFCLSILLLLFIYSNHLEYLNKMAVYNALSGCGSAYNELYFACIGNGTSNQSDIPVQKYHLNLTIERWT